jgi:peroxiredoxin Q/BCP
MEPGDLIDDFTLPDQSGAPRTLSELCSSGPVVLFFYPAAMTSGCTKESCHFRDLGAEFASVGAVRVGISMDTVDKQAAFAEKHHFDYPLLADTDGTVAKAFGVKRRFDVLRTKRATFVIGTDRRLRAKISSETSMTKHADKALELLRAGQDQAGSS